MLMQQPIFSVLVPTHNRRRTLAYALRSILLQTIKDFEIIVIGDGCTDDTADFMRAQADPRIRWMNLTKAPHFGYENRNIAIATARGRYIAYCSDDNLLFPDHLEKMLQEFSSSQCEVVCSRPIWVDPDCRLLPSFENLSMKSSQRTFVDKWNEFPLTCFANKAPCYEKYGGWPTDMSHSADWEMWKRMLCPNEFANLSFVSDPTCLHFRADWRTEANAGSSRLIALRNFSLSEDWPADLRERPERKGSLAQELLLEAIELEPKNCIETWRRAVEQSRDLICKSTVDNLDARGAVESQKPIANCGYCISDTDQSTYECGKVCFGCGFSAPLSNGVRWVGASRQNSIRIEIEGADTPIIFGIVAIHYDRSALDHIPFDSSVNIDRFEVSDIVRLQSHEAVVLQFVFDAINVEDIQLSLFLKSEQRSDSTRLGLATGPVSLARSASVAQALDTQREELLIQLKALGNVDLFGEYLNQNSDVLDAVNGNAHLTGKKHFEKCGQFEQRTGRPVWRQKLV